jgi:hypothetical protein
MKQIKFYNGAITIVCTYNKIKTTGATSGAGTPYLYPSSPSDFSRVWVAFCPKLHVFMFLVF